jgi:hypothetical protein
MAKNQHRLAEHNQNRVVSPQTPWSRRWTAAIGGPRLKLLARRPRGSRCELSNSRGATHQSGARICVITLPRPTDLLAGAPTLPLELKEVNVDN